MLNLNEINHKRNISNAYYFIRFNQIKRASVAVWNEQDTDTVDVCHRIRKYSFANETIKLFYAFEFFYFPITYSMSTSIMNDKGLFSRRIESRNKA